MADEVDGLRERERRGREDEAGGNGDEGTHDESIVCRGGGGGGGKRSSGKSHGCENETRKIYFGYAKESGGLRGVARASCPRGEESAGRRTFVNHHSIVMVIKRVIT